MLYRDQYSIKDYTKRYRKKLRRINKRRQRRNTNKYIEYELDIEQHDKDLWLAHFINDADYIEYKMFDEDAWLEYTGRTWTLDDELEYCDKVFNNIDEELDKQLVEDVLIGIRLDDSPDPINKACIALKACRSMQELFIKYGVKGRHKLLFDLEEK